MRLIVKNDKVYSWHKGVCCEFITTYEAIVYALTGEKGNGEVIDII